MKKDSAKNRKCTQILAAIFCAATFFLLIYSAAYLPKVSAKAGNEIEDAIYTRTEFFGAEAVLLLPTREARENLLRLREKFPENRQVLEKLADFDEKLLNFDDAEKNLLQLAEMDFSKNELLAEFYGRRGKFEKQAQIYHKILFSIDVETRPAVFEKLIDLSRIHELRDYLQTDFYNQIIAENPNVFPIFKKLVDKLLEENNYTEALKFLRLAKNQFPEYKNLLLEQEIEILLELNRADEAEKIYTANFDPFWSDQESETFYSFLSRHDKLRAYGASVKNRFRKNPADFDAAIRLAHYRNYYYGYENNNFTSIFFRLEQTKKIWTTDEMVMAARILLRQNEGKMASRFLYTLWLRDDFQKNSELRAKVLYQLFEMFSDVGDERLPITKGDLRFYEDVAKADTNVGITTGVLSLIFSGTNPREKLAGQEEKAAKLFNRAAAYRIFLAYKEEFPNAPETAQMYLDVVRLYAAIGKTEIAEKTLNEFAEKYENALEFSAAALKLADAFKALKQPAKTREIYQKILDYIGKQGRPLKPKRAENFSSLFENSESSVNKFATAEIADRNDGINIPKPERTPKKYEYEELKTGKFHDYLGRKTAAVTYSEVLGNFVASLAEEKKTVEILALYSREISKYPNEEFLYEQRLSWLEQANLTDEQLQVYKTALERFQTNGWRDKLLRFFVRQNRKAEFAELSEDLILKLGDAETAEFLDEFTDFNFADNEFETKLNLKLYEKARERFPHNIFFTQGLLRLYKAAKRSDDWRKLCAENYFQSNEIRQEFIYDLSEKDELRAYLQKSKIRESSIYELFRADAAAYLSDYENAVNAYRKLNEIYPNTPEFQSRLINFARSFGQKNRADLSEAAVLAENQADFHLDRADLRTQSGEICAELGNYEKARQEWEKLILTARGDKEIYLETATVYWDYFQYDDALRTIKNLREKYENDALYAFETGAIFEGQKKIAKAVGEYVKALAETDETRRAKAVRRLASLYNSRSVVSDENFKNQKPEIDNFLSFVGRVYSEEFSKGDNNSLLPIGYAEFLFKIEQNEQAENVLNRAVNQSTDADFVKSALEVFEIAEIETGEQNALRRLGEIAETPRAKIGFVIRLAESFEENQKRSEAEYVLAKLIRDFPTNYGVLLESAEIYNRLGAENKAIEVLQNALPKSLGTYKFALSEKLAARLIRQGKLGAAEGILLELHNENKADINAFEELAKIYLRQNNAAKLREVFAETLAAIKESDETDRRELNEKIADLRGRMIDAFTRLKDYKSAVEQHIEIINRDPESEELTEDAIRYVKRYGGAEMLLNYYLKLSAESFKNYRWNVVLARIYETDGDFENAIKNYQTAIANQPEMPELYEAIAEIETRRGNFDAALQNFEKILELTNNAPEFVKKKIEILKKAGRGAEAENEKTKLPAETEPAISEFVEARSLARTEREKAREIYKSAFRNLLQNPLQNEFNAADITGFVQAARDEESLAVINKNLWNLREKLAAIAGKSDSDEAGEARKRLSILENAIVESVGTIARDVATDDELKDLHEQFQAAIENAANNDAGRRTAALIENLAARAGFGDLQEKILIRTVEIEKDSSERHLHLQKLIDFYNERGAFQKTFDALEKFANDNSELKAEIAKLLGNKEKELESLRKIYWRTGETSEMKNVFVERYLQILNAENRDELRALTEKSSVYQLQLINFLLGAGERELAHAAIENSVFPKAWKVSRNAETSLALQEFDDDAECYFCDALQFDSIENLIAQTPDKKSFLINDDWFRLSRRYGEWLLGKGETSREADRFLPSMTENLPASADEQFKLGEFYLAQNNFLKAMEHLQLSIEIENLAVADKTKAATLGAAFYKTGKKDLAEKLWSEVLEDKQAASGVIYFKVLQKYGLSSQAREKLSNIIIEFLANSDAGDSRDFQNLIRETAKSFSDEKEKSAWFLQILQMRPTDKSLAEMLLAEHLIAEEDRGDFYEILNNRYEENDDYDYEYEAIFQRVWENSADAESIYDAENDFKSESDETEREKFQKEFLLYLLEKRENVKAEKLISQIEAEFRGHKANPDWLRTAKIHLQIRRGRFDPAEAERFIGITAADAVSEIKPPSVERFNEILRVLREENSLSEAMLLSKSFFARMIALEKFGTANFIGLSRAFFQKGKTDKALKILQIMIDAGNVEKRETALAEISNFAEIKRRQAELSKLKEAEDVLINQTETITQAAELAFEFKQFEKAAEFRRQLLEIAPDDAENRFKLAEILLSKDEKAEAVSLFNDLINGKNTPRRMRWEARIILRQAGENIDLPNYDFDFYSQFYNGITADQNEEKSAAEEFFIKCLTLDKDAETVAKQRLLELYTENGKLFAALRLAENDKSAKSDETLDLLSQTAEKVGEFLKAIEFETTKTDGGNQERIKILENLQIEKSRRATDFRVDKNNTGNV